MKPRGSSSRRQRSPTRRRSTCGDGGPGSPRWGGRGDCAGSGGIRGRSDTPGKGGSEERAPGAGVAWGPGVPAGAVTCRPRDSGSPSRTCCWLSRAKGSAPGAGGCGHRGRAAGCGAAAGLAGGAGARAAVGEPGSRLAGWAAGARCCRCCCCPSSPRPPRCPTGCRKTPSPIQTSVKLRSALGSRVTWRAGTLLPPTSLSGLSPRRRLKGPVALAGRFVERGLQGPWGEPARAEPERPQRLGFAAAPAVLPTLGAGAPAFPTYPGCIWSL